MSGRFVTGLVLFVIGLWIWLSNIGLLNFERDWPFILVVIGIYFIIASFSKGGLRRKDYRKILKELEEGKIDAQEALRRIEEKVAKK